MTVNTTTARIIMWRTQPVDELDDDGDDWVECVRDIDVVWNAHDESDEPNHCVAWNRWHYQWYIVCSDIDDNSCTGPCTDGDGNACTVDPSECQPHSSREHSDCDDADPDTHPYVAFNEYDDGDGVGPYSCVRDFDGDGYGDAAPTIAGVTAGHDCNDSSPDVHPRK